VEAAAAAPAGASPRGAEAAARPRAFPRPSYSARPHIHAAPVPAAAPPPLAADGEPELAPPGTEVGGQAGSGVWVQWMERA